METISKKKIVLCPLKNISIRCPSDNNYIFIYFLLTKNYLPDIQCSAGCRRRGNC